MSAAARALQGSVEPDPELRSENPTGQTAQAESDLLETSAHDDIARLAYALWQHRGCPSESAETDWLEAEQRLRERVGVGSLP